MATQASLQKTATKGRLILCSQGNASLPKIGAAGSSQFRVTGLCGNAWSVWPESVVSRLADGRSLYCRICLSIRGA